MGEQRMFDLKGLKIFNEIKSALGSGMIRVTGCVPSQLEHMIWQLGDGFDAKVIITFDEPKAMDILSSYKAFDDNGVYYPAKDPVFDKADIRGTYLSEQRLEITKRLFDKENLTVITILDAFSEELSSFREISKDLITIKTGDTVNMEELSKRLVELGYENESQVGAHGEFSLRGNIIDIFPFFVRNIDYLRLKYQFIVCRNLPQYTLIIRCKCAEKFGVNNKRTRNGLRKTININCKRHFVIVI